MAPAGSSSSPPPPSGPCIRCKEQPASLELRTEPVCNTCFSSFIQSKAVKRLEVLQRETRSTTSTSTSTTTKGNPNPGAPSSPPQRYLVALSLGPSSAALLHVLCANARRQRSSAGGRVGARFELVAVHVDTSCVDHHSPPPPPPRQQGEEKEEGEGDDDPLRPYRALFPEVSSFRVVQLSSSALARSLPALLPPPPTTTTTPGDLASTFQRLPSASARADVRRHLVRGALAAAAAEERCAVVLLGYSTTALAELTLSEAAKGRGFAVPAAVGDGVAAASSFFLPQGTAANDDDDTAGEKAETPGIPVYSPLRELFRKELLQYLSICSPAITPHLPLSLLSLPPPPSSTSGSGSVVSHKDLSIDDVMARYFGEVEAAYPSVVANVVRTAGKLRRGGGGGGKKEEKSGGGAAGFAVQCPIRRGMRGGGGRSARMRRKRRLRK